MKKMLLAVRVAGRAQVGSGRVGSGAGAAVLGAGAFAGKNAQTMTRLGILYWPRNPASRSPIVPILQFKLPWCINKVTLCNC
jgi:hypothetical protein